MASSSEGYRDMQQASRDMASMTTAAKQELGETAAQAERVARQQLETLSEQIRRNPLQAAGIAAGVGFLLAMLARR